MKNLTLLDRYLDLYEFIKKEKGVPALDEQLFKELAVNDKEEQHTLTEARMTLEHLTEEYSFSNSFRSSLGEASLIGSAIGILAGSVGYMFGISLVGIPIGIATGVSVVYNQNKTAKKQYVQLQERIKERYNEKIEETKKRDEFLFHHIILDDSTKRIIN